MYSRRHDPQLRTLVSSTEQKEATPANAVCAFFFFTGHAAEIMRQETADAASDLRHVLQSAVERDVAAAVHHLGVSVHAVRAVAGPAVRAAMQSQRVDPRGATAAGAGEVGLRHADPGGASTAGLACAVAVRTGSSQQCAAVTVSLRGSLPNAGTFHSVSRLMAHVCCAKPTRVAGDAKWRTPWHGAVFSVLLRIDEVPQQPALQPRWFASLFAGASHILHPHGLDKYIAAPDAVLMAPSLRDVEAASRLRNPPPLYVTYASPGRDGARGGWRSSTGAGAIVCASEADATFVPVPARTSMPAPASLTSYYSRSPSQISEESEVAMDEPILMSRTRL